jgi:hypothetical protein
MKMSLVARGKRHDVSDVDGRIDANFDQLFADVKAIVLALKGKKIDLTSADDVAVPLPPGSGTTP